MECGHWGSKSLRGGYLLQRQGEGIALLQIRKAKSCGNLGKTQEVETGSPSWGKNWGKWDDKNRNSSKVETWYATEKRKLQKWRKELGNKVTVTAP